MREGRASEWHARYGSRCSACRSCITRRNVNHTEINDPPTAHAAQSGRREPHPSARQDEPRLLPRPPVHARLPGSEPRGPSQGWGARGGVGGLRALLSTDAVFTVTSLWSENVTELCFVSLPSTCLVGSSRYGNTSSVLGFVQEPQTTLCHGSSLSSKNYQSFLLPKFRQSREQASSN